MNANEVNSIIDELYEIIQDARALPLSADKCIVSREHILDLLDEIVSVLPEDFKKAQSIVSSRNELINQARKEAENTITSAQMQATNAITLANNESERVKANAKAEAENIIKNAKAKAQEMVSNESVYKEAEKQSKEMIAKANAQISELKATSFKYMADSLQKTVSTIEASLRDVKETHAKFDSMTKESQMPISKPTNNRMNSFTDISID